MQDTSTCRSSVARGQIVGSCRSRTRAGPGQPPGSSPVVGWLFCPWLVVEGSLSQDKSCVFQGLSLLRVSVSRESLSLAFPGEQVWQTWRWVGFARGNWARFVNTSWVTDLCKQEGLVGGVELEQESKDQDLNPWIETCFTENHRTLRVFNLLSETSTRHPTSLLSAWTVPPLLLPFLELGTWHQVISADLQNASWLQLFLSIPFPVFSERLLDGNSTSFNSSSHPSLLKHRSGHFISLLKSFKRSQMLLGSNVTLLAYPISQLFQPWSCYFFYLTCPVVQSVWTVLRSLHTLYLSLLCVLFLLPEQLCSLLCWQNVFGLFVFGGGWS